MKTIKLQTPDGKTLSLSAPDDASPDQIHQAAVAASQDYSSKIGGPKNPIPEDVVNEPGLKDVSATPITKPDLQQVGAQSQKEWEQMGHPTIGKITNAGVSNLGELASMLLPAPGVAKAVTPSLKEAAAVAFSPTVKNAGIAEGEALAKAGLEKPLETIADPRSRKAILETAAQAKNIVDEGVEGISELLNPQQMLDQRTKLKQLMDFLRVNQRGVLPKQLAAKETQSYFAKANDVLTQALSNAHPEVGDAIKTAANSYKRSNIINNVVGAPTNALGWALRRLGGLAR